MRRRRARGCRTRRGRSRRHRARSATRCFGRDGALWVTRSPGDAGSGGHRSRRLRLRGALGPTLLRLGRLGPGQHLGGRGGVVPTRTLRLGPARRIGPGTLFGTGGLLGSRALTGARGLFRPW